MRQARVRAYRRGRFAETVVALLLRLKGHRIVAQRYKTPRRRDRPRGAQGQASRLHRGEAAQDRGRRRLGTLPAKQRRRIVRAAQYWLAGHPDFAGHDIAFDVVLAAPWAWPRYIENPFSV